MRANPFPMLTSRVCPHTCQSKCNQCKNGDSVSIHSAESALEAMGIHFIFHMAVMPGFSRKYPITLRFVSLDQGIQGAEAQQREALDILSRTIHGMEADAQGIWHVPGWKGQICFGKEIGGAFGMDQAPVIPVWER